LTIIKSISVIGIILESNTFSLDNSHIKRENNKKKKKKSKWFKSPCLLKRSKHLTLKNYIIWHYKEAKRIRAQLPVKTAIAFPKLPNQANALSIGCGWWSWPALSLVNNNNTNMALTCTSPCLSFFPLQAAWSNREMKKKHEE